MYCHVPVSFVKLTSFMKFIKKQFLKINIEFYVNMDKMMFAQ